MGGEDNRESGRSGVLSRLKMVDALSVALLKDHHSETKGCKALLYRVQAVFGGEMSPLPFRMSIFQLNSISQKGITCQKY